MNIIAKNQSIFVSKPEGNDINYYLRDEYEVHYNEQKPHTIQTWHHHERVFESLYIFEGELVAEWKDGEKQVQQVIKTGDLIEVEKSPHTFTNRSDKTVKYIAIKQVLSGQNKRDIFKNDKIRD